MSKKLSKAQKAKKASEANQSTLSRRKFILIPAAVAAIGVAAVGINAYETNQRELHDLSVIGNGTPTVVQIHDQTCQICMRLKKITKTITNDDDRVQYRIADISSKKGRAFQQQYNQTKTTLLYFDSKGKHVHTTNGLQDADNIQASIENLISRKRFPAN